MTTITLSPPAARSVSPEGRAIGERVASWAIVAAVAGFLALIVPAMRAYPGGTAWDSTTQGSDFWLNYLSDLQRSIALNGEPNAAGAALAQTAMLLLAGGLAAFWWLAARLCSGRPRLAHTLRMTGVAGVVGSVAVSFMPSDRFGDGHALAIVLGGVPGLIAAGLAVVGLASRGRAARVAAAIGTATVLVSSADFLLYVVRLEQGGPDLIAIAILERLSIILILAWMLAIARHSARASSHRRGPAAIGIAAAALVTSTPCAAVEEPPDEANVEHPRALIDIDFTLVNIGVSVAGHIGGGGYVGLGFSVLPAFAFSTFEPYPLELIETHAFVRYDMIRIFQVEAGARASAFEEFCFFDPCTSGVLFGGYADLRVGFPAFKVGPRIEYAFREDTGATGLLLWPLLLHVELAP